MSDYAVVNPATGETVKEYPTISDDDLRDAIGRADTAVREWSASTTVEERSQLVRRVGEIHAEQRERLAEIIVREMGKPVEQALGELDFCAAIYEYYADNAPKLLADEDDRAARRRRLGVSSAAAPTAPCSGSCRGTSPTTRWRASRARTWRSATRSCSSTRRSARSRPRRCRRSTIEAGFPADAYINIYATNEQIEWVIADPRVRGVSLTGSERAGAAVAEIAGRNLKKIVLELGGSDPFILLSTDDLDTAVENAVAARVDNTGQSCNAAKRFIVVDELYEPFLEKFTDAITEVEPGDPTKSETEIGPLSSSLATERLADQLQRALDKGAKLVAGGEHEGNFFKTTVLTDISSDNPARHEEFFGPVAQVYRVKDEEEAVELANDTPYGLGSYLMTTDAEQARRVAEKIEAGMVFVNLVGADGAELPFGGVKRSGFGRELGRYGIDEFVNKKLIRIGG